MSVHVRRNRCSRSPKSVFTFAEIPIQAVGPAQRWNPRRKSRSTVSSPIFACRSRRVASCSHWRDALPPPKISSSPSMACRFQVLTWFGWTTCLAAISCTVRSPRKRLERHPLLEVRREPTPSSRRHPSASRKVLEYTLARCPKSGATSRVPLGVGQVAALGWRPGRAGGDSAHAAGSENQRVRLRSFRFVVGSVAEPMSDSPFGSISRSRSRRRQHVIHSARDGVSRRPLARHQGLEMRLPAFDFRPLLVAEVVCE